MRSERVENAVLALILTVVGLAAGAAAFTHMHDWTMTNSPEGTADWFGWANACISELVPVAALLNIRQRRRRGESITYPMLLLLGASVLSLSAQIAVAEPSPSGWLLSAVPALAFIALSKLIASGKPTVPELPARQDDMDADDDADAIEELHAELADPWRYATPLATATLPHADAGPEPADNVGAPPPAQPRQRDAGSAVTRVRPRALTSASKVEAAAANLPAGATMAEIAAKAGVSESTVRRYRPRAFPVPPPLGALPGALVEVNGAASPLVRAVSS